MLGAMRREASIEVSKLLEASSEGLQLTLLSDWGSLDRKIAHMRIQKPGLALSGFVKHINRHFQIVAHGVVLFTPLPVLLAG